MWISGVFGHVCIIVWLLAAVNRRKNQCVVSGRQSYRISSRRLAVSENSGYTRYTRKMSVEPVSASIPTLCRTAGILKNVIYNEFSRDSEQSSSASCNRVSSTFARRRCGCQHRIAMHTRPLVKIDSINLTLKSLKVIAAS